MKIIDLSTTFTTAERGYIRRELDHFFSTVPSVAEGSMMDVYPASAPKRDTVAATL